ncbi:response regulator [Photobacterium angustum]|uniref:response regulator n=1 Tax=Photobacterium angustum TaxID=661 RepID=UPI000A54E8C0
MNQTRVLVVEDDEGLREALVDTLALAGYQWIEAESAEHALVIMKSETVDIVVSDVQMAGMDGLALLRSIKLNWPKIPVLLMTLTPILKMQSRRCVKVRLIIWQNPLRPKCC